MAAILVRRAAATVSIYHAHSLIVTCVRVRDDIVGIGVCLRLLVSEESGLESLHRDGAAGDCCCRHWLGLYKQVMVLLHV